MRILSHTLISHVPFNDAMLFISGYITLFNTRKKYYKTVTLQCNKLPRRPLNINHGSEWQNINEHFAYAVSSCLLIFSSL